MKHFRDSQAGREDSRVSSLKRQLNFLEICRSLDEKGLTKREAYPWWTGE